MESKLTYNPSEIKLTDRYDRLGSNITWYISTILTAFKNNYKISFVKPKPEYRFYDSIFVKLLFNVIDDYNAKHFENTTYEYKLITEESDYFKKMIYNVMDIKCDLMTAFKSDVFIQKFRDNFNELAKSKKYSIPYNTEKTIVVHLRLDDRSHRFVNYNTRKQSSINFKNIIDNDDINYKWPGSQGQSAIKEYELIPIINKALDNYKDYEVFVITNGPHKLPYKTICSSDENYDLFLLANSTVLIGSMSTFCFSAMLFGNHKTVYYPLWDHGSMWGLTTKYDKTDNIVMF